MYDMLRKLCSKEKLKKKSKTSRNILYETAPSLINTLRKFLVDYDFQINKKNLFTYPLDCSRIRQNRTSQDKLTSHIQKYS